jgi:hypothetical protein
VWTGTHEKYGLMWVGEKFYPTPDHFMNEAARMGISKRIPMVPKEFEMGKDWILLAHRKTIQSQYNPQEYIPGIFQAFRPTRIEYIP